MDRRRPVICIIVETGHFSELVKMSHLGKRKIKTYTVEVLPSFEFVQTNNEVGVVYLIVHSTLSVRYNLRTCTSTLVDESNSIGL